MAITYTSREQMEVYRFSAPVAIGVPIAAVALQSLMQPYDGPVNWQLATDIARRTSAQEPDPSPDSAVQGRVADAFRLADHWLDSTTTLP